MMSVPLLSLFCALGDFADDVGTCSLLTSRLTVDFSPAAVGAAPPASFLPPLSDAPAPLLGWWLTPAPPGGAVSNESQSAYRITVATAPALLPGAPDVWDSGVVASSNQVGVRYDGRALPARARVFWRVEVWDGGGAACGAGAEVGAWEVPLLSFPGDWAGASWITAGPPPPANATDCDYYKDAPAPLFRAPFALAQPPTAVVRARLYATGLGYVTPMLDGAQVVTRRWRPRGPTLAPRCCSPPLTSRRTSRAARLATARTCWASPRATGGGASRRCCFGGT